MTAVRLDLVSHFRRRFHETHRYADRLDDLLNRLVADARVPVLVRAELQHEWDRITEEVYG